jgi:hypothetical protein
MSAQLPSGSDNLELTTSTGAPVSAWQPPSRIGPESQQQLADALSVLGRFADAERLAAAAAPVATQMLGDRHPVTIAAHDSRARALIGLRRAGEAEAILRVQLAILEARTRQGQDAGEGDALTGT